MIDNSNPAGVKKLPWPGWILLSFALLAAAATLRYFDDSFGYDVALSDMPIAALVAGYCLCSGLIFLFLPLLIGQSRRSSSKSLLLFIFFSGLLMRLVFFGSLPVLEDDYNRYLWDGAVTASGGNPYADAPADIANDDAGGALTRSLKAEAGEVFERINYPEYSTVYPAVAQGAFAISYFVSPFSLDAWRLVLLVAEFGTLLLIVCLLRAVGRSSLWAAFYWWNPVVLKEISNSAHLEPLLILPLLAAVYLAMHQRFIWGSALFAVAGGVKIWPILLFAVPFRQLLNRVSLLVVATGTMTILLALQLWPILAAGLNDHSGFAAFAQHWKASSAAFLVSAWLVDTLSPIWITEWVGSGLVIRALLGLMLLVVIAVICRLPAPSSRDLLFRLFLVSAVVYVLLPSQTPWYFTWMVPFLCLFPVRGLMLVGVLIPLHYLYFHLAAREMADVYRYGVVWLIWLPVWGLLAYDFLSAPRSADVPVKDPYAAQS